AAKSANPRPAGRWSTPRCWCGSTAWTRCATSCCGRCPPAPTAPTRRRRWCGASTRTWPTTWATASSARCPCSSGSPAGALPSRPAGQDDGVLQETAERVFDEVEAALDRFELDKALQIAWELPKRVNKYIDENAPWELHKQGREAKLRTVLYNAAEAIRLSGVLVAP